MKKKNGFSMLELLAVCLVILILSAITIPNMLQIVANNQGANAVSAVRAMTIANFDYYVVNQSYASSVSVLTAAKLTIPIITPTGTMNGYSYTYTPSGTAYTYTAIPVSGQGQSFYTDQTGVVRFANNAIAGSSSPVVTYFPQSVPPGPPGIAGPAGAAGTSGSGSATSSSISASCTVGSTCPGPTLNNNTPATWTYVISGESAAATITLPASSSMGTAYAGTLLTVVNAGTTTNSVKIGSNPSLLEITEGNTGYFFVNSSGVWSDSIQ